MIEAGNGNRLEMRGVGYWYKQGKEKNVILRDASYLFDSGVMYAVMGKSGIGKSTMLSLLGALDDPREGEILYNGENIKKMGYEKYRRNVVSIIFQDYNLLPYLTGYQNIELALRLAKGRDADEKEIERFLDMVEISHETARRNVRRISGGEQQRIAIARTLAMDAEVILGDEPTGNLDEDTAEEIIDLLHRLAHEEDKCVITVTHTRALAERADEVLQIAEKKFGKQM